MQIPLLLQSTPDNCDFSFMILDANVQLITPYQNFCKKSIEVNSYSIDKMCVSKEKGFFLGYIVRYFNILEKSINSRKDQVCHHKTYTFLLLATKKNEIYSCLGIHHFINLIFYVIYS